MFESLQGQVSNQILVDYKKKLIEIENKVLLDHVAMLLDYMIHLETLGNFVALVLVLVSRLDCF